MGKKELLRKCPICGGSTGEILYKQKFILTENSILPPQYDLVYCIDCGFVFADTSASQEDYNIYYSEFSKYEDSTIATGGFFRAEDIMRQERTAADLSLFIKRTDKILDIGCANGGLLYALKKLGYKNLLGIDPSIKCIENITALGISAIEGGLFSDNFKKDKWVEEKFDCIILSHVLEHIYDLDLAVKNCLELLNDRGILYIEVPNATCYSNYYIVPNYYFDCEHINHFSINSFNNLLKKLGFELLHEINKELIVSEDKKYPALGLIYSKATNIVTNYEFKKENEVKNEILAYIKKSMDDLRFNIIDQLYLSQEKIIVWGAGSYTLRLLSDTNLDKCSIVAFVDNDSKKRGSKLLNKNISSPQILEKHGNKILICSALHNDEIIHQIKEMGISNEVVTV